VYGAPVLRRAFILPGALPRSKEKFKVKITTVETIHLRKARPPFIFVRVYTDEGLVRLGQTADTRTAAVVHDPAARFPIGKEPL